MPLGFGIARASDTGHERRMSDPSATTPDAPPALRAAGIVKQFPGVRALDGAQLTLRPGEIHALMGENGAGKSTIIKVINGVYSPEEGTVEVEGQPVSPRSVREAEALGISTVFQEVNLIPMRSVSENLFLGQFPRTAGLIRWRQVHREAEKRLATLGLSLDVKRPVASCSVAMQQMVAIARAVGGGVDGQRKAKVLILDEPTASLDNAEIEQLFGVMRQLRDQGVAILFVTHFLDQVYAVCDRITVLRNGSFVCEEKTKDLPKLKLIGAMTGRDIHAHDAEAEAAAEAAEARGSEGSIRIEGLGLKRTLEPVNFTIGKGEVVGLAGLLGSGRTEVARLCFGVDKADSGHLEMNGKQERFTSPRQAIRNGLAMTTEERKTSGIAPNLSVRENLILALQSRRGIFRRIPKAKQRELADKYIKALRIKTPSSEQQIRLLSGGNQQKVLLARWLAIDPTLLILDEPTRGIDVGAKAEVARLVTELSREGMSVLFISSEFEETAEVCRHVVVLRDRHQVGELHGKDITEGQIMRMIAGSSAGKEPPQRGFEVVDAEAVNVDATSKEQH